MRNLKNAPLLTEIEKDGQEYLDRPIYAKPKEESIIASSVKSAFGRRKAIPIAIGLERVFLQWVKPGADGKLIPR